MFFRLMSYSVTHSHSTCRSSQMRQSSLSSGALHSIFTENCPLVHRNRQLSWQLLQATSSPLVLPVRLNELYLKVSNGQLGGAVWGSLSALLKISEGKLLRWHITITPGNWPTTHTHTNSEKREKAHTCSYRWHRHMKVHTCT